MKRDTLQHQINVIAEKARKWEITQIAEERGDGHVTREDSHRTWLAYEYARDALIDRLCGEEEGEEPSPSEDGVERLAQNLYAADHPDRQWHQSVDTVRESYRRTAAAFYAHFGR